LSTKSNAINMLILDPSSNDVEQTANILRNSGHPVRTTQILSEEDLENALERQKWDLFIVRDNLKNPSAEQCFKITQHYGCEIPFVLITADYSIERTLEALRLGMKDVIPEDNDEYFKLVIERELSNIEDRRIRQHAEKILTETSRRNELLLESSRDAIAYITDGMHIYANQAYMELFGYEDPEDLECMPIMDLMAAKGHEEFKKYLKQHSKGEELDDFSFIGLNQNSTTFEAYLSLTDSVYDGENCTQVYIKTTEASDEELEQKLKEISSQDRLTGLFNQHYFIECLEKAIGQAESHCFILYIELDSYNNIQNRYGITQTDYYLKDASEWLHERMSSDDVLARIGDSSFAILTKIDSNEEAETLGDKLCDQFSKHLFEINNHTITDSLSIGICPIDENVSSSEKLLSNGHFASHRVSSKGGNGFQLFDSTLDDLSSRDEAKTAMELQDAMDAGRIYPLFEPIVKLHGNADKIFNASLAIDSTEGERQKITDIFRIGHQSPTALKLDNWLMMNSFKILSEYLSSQSRGKLKIYLSAASLVSSNLIQNIKALLEQNNLPQDSVIFEFREKDIAAHLKHAINVYNEMSENHFISALNGFGDTNDSKTVLDTISCDSLKWVSLESSLFNDFVSNSETQEKVRDLLSFIHDKGLTSIAPGISDAVSMATIYPMGVHHIQGDYIGDLSRKMSFDFSEIAF